MEEESVTVQCLQIKLSKSLTIIRTYDWLINAYVLDFYVDEHWSKLPSSWRHLEDLPPEDLSVLLDNSTNLAYCGRKNHSPWPLSLLVLKVLFKDLCVKRQVQHQGVSAQTSLLDHPKLKHVFMKNVKWKKRHEVERMAAVCVESCRNAPVDFVVDFGAGLGHLARVLGYGHGIRVCCLEMQAALNAQAHAVDVQMEALIHKYLNPGDKCSYQRPTHVTLCLTADMGPAEFIETIGKALGLANKDFRFGIIGLHPCGDLAVILMRIFLQCTQAKFLNFVGCCYMKLSTRVTQPTQELMYGFPLSEHLKLRSQTSQLSYEAREISCHAAELYYDRLSQCDYNYLKVHSYRAAAERVILKHYPDLKHIGLRSVKYKTGMQFADYFYKAVQGLPIERLSPEKLNTSITEHDLAHWKRVVVFYTLRLFFAPLVESVILYDRMLFLMENGCQVQINAIFDPRLSPRNHITSATKRS